MKTKGTPFFFMYFIGTAAAPCTRYNEKKKNKIQQQRAAALGSNETIKN